MVEIVEREYYAAVKLAPKWENSTVSAILEKGTGIQECMPSICIQQNSFVSPVNSIVGMLKNQRLESVGKEGFLHFGPYVPMEKGNYRLLIYGTAKEISSAWVDIVSKQGTITHGRFKLHAKPEKSDQILVSEPVTLNSAVHDVEIRVYIGARDQVSLKGYSLK